MILTLLPPEWGTFLNAFKEDLSAPPYSELLFHISKSEVCGCEPGLQGESIVHQDHQHFRALAQGCHSKKLPRNLRSIETGDTSDDNLWV